MARIALMKPPGTNSAQVQKTYTCVLSARFADFLDAAPAASAMVWVTRGLIA